MRLELSFILLDVCGTVFDFQTADLFVKFVLKRYGKGRRGCLAGIIDHVSATGIGSKLLRILFGGRRKLYVRLLRGIPCAEMQRLGRIFFEEMLRSQVAADVLSFLGRYPEADVIIVSGGYRFYLEPLSDFLEADRCVCSELEEVNGILTGRIAGVDCMGIGKVLKLHEYGVLPGIPFERTAVLSDSFSDMPLFALGKYKIAVNPDDMLRKLLGKGWSSILDFVRATDGRKPG